MRSILQPFVLVGSCSNVEHCDDPRDFCVLGVDVSKKHLDAHELPSGRSAPGCALGGVRVDRQLPPVDGGQPVRQAAADADQSGAGEALRQGDQGDREDRPCGRAAAGEAGPHDAGLAAPDAAAPGARRGDQGEDGAEVPPGARLAPAGAARDSEGHEARRRADRAHQRGAGAAGGRGRGVLAQGRAAGDDHRDPRADGHRAARGGAGARHPDHPAGRQPGGAGAGGRRLG